MGQVVGDQLRVGLPRLDRFQPLGQQVAQQRTLAGSCFVAPVEPRQARFVDDGEALGSLLLQPQFQRDQLGEVGRARLLVAGAPPLLELVHLVAGEHRGLELGRQLGEEVLEVDGGVAPG